MITDTQLINASLQAKKPMGEAQFLEKELNVWLNSPERKALVDGTKYYRGKQDILNKQRMAIGKDGPVPIQNVANNKIMDNQYAKLVDQKANYLLALKPSVEGEEKAYIDALQSVFNNRFLNLLRKIGIDALNCGTGWMYVYPEANELQFVRFQPHEILPYWSDIDHTKLDAVLRVFDVEEYEGAEKKIVQKVEFYDLSGIRYYDFKDGKLILTDKKTQLISADQAYNWEKLPIVPFKYNAAELSLLSRVRSLQDAINQILSKFADDMNEDIRTTIIVLKGYGGENLAVFRDNLARYGVIDVNNNPDNPGDVSTLRIEVNAENYKLILELLKEKLIENGRGLDSKNDKMSGTPNQMNIKSMYSDLDLDANGMEAEFQQSLEDLQWFIKKWLLWTGKGNFENSTAEITFNRDILMSEAEAITMCKDSEGVVSKETILTNHPWVEDVQKELSRVKKEQEEQINNYPQFPPNGQKAVIPHET